MKKSLLFFALFFASLNLFATDPVTNPYSSHFEKAYQLYPEIPKGILEAVAFTNSRFEHITYANENDTSCIGLPRAYGVMALTLDGKDYFRSNLNFVSELSGYSKKDIIDDPEKNILAYAKAYAEIMKKAKSIDGNPETHVPVLIALSELPVTDDVQNDFAMNSQLYSILSFLDDSLLQVMYDFPAYDLDLVKIFGEQNYKILSSPHVLVSDTGIQDKEGNQYQKNSGPQASQQLLSLDYPPAIWNPTTCNFSNRNSSVSAVTVHTVQGSYAGCISWFKNCSAGVSAHYVIRSSDGQVTQMVREYKKAWHVGIHNPYTIGLEHEGYISNAAWYTTAMYTSSANLVKDICLSGYGIAGTTCYNGPSCTGSSNTCLISTTYRIKGHQHYSSQSHTDPGINWNWPLYYCLINNCNNQTVAAPPPPTVSTNNCGNKTLTRATPPSGVTYYWQGTSCGTSTANSSQTYTATSSGTYYLRARSSNGTWSTCSSVSVTVNQIPSTPPAPTVSTNSCGSKTLTRGTPPSGVTYYWQGTSCGTSTANSSVNYTATASGTYYLRARSSAGCWSSSCVSVNVTVTPSPAAPPAPTVSNNSCGPKTLTRPNPPSGTTYYWQGTSCGTSTANSASTYTVTTTGTYYLRARSSQGCWSNCTSVSVTVDPCPSNLTASVSACPTADVTFSWTNASSNWSLEVSLDPAFNTVHTRSASNITTLSAPSGFTPALVWQPNATYHWRIVVGTSYFPGPTFTVPFCDGTAPTTSIAPVTGWQSTNFTASFTDADNSGGSGLGKRFYRVIDFNGTQWRANPDRGFFNDNFDDTIVHADWISYDGAWSSASGFLVQTDEASNNTNISARLTQNLSNRYLYHWNAKIEGSGTNRRAGLHFFCDSDSLSNRGNSYFVWFRVDNGKLQFYKVVNNVFTLVKSKDYNFVAGQYYDFKLVYDRILGKMDMYINNILEESWVDATPIQNGQYISFRTGNSAMSVNFMEVYRSRFPSVTVNVGAANTNDIRYENSSPTLSAGKIESVASDSSGNLSTVASTLVDVDWSAPSAVNIVNDGTGPDISTTYLTSQLSANWSPAADPGSGVSKYYYSIGTTPGDSDLVGWTNNQTQLMVMHNSLPLVMNQTYYFNVVAQNGAGLLSPVTSSNGQTVIYNTTDIEEITPVSGLNAYPNPFNNTVTIDYTLGKTQTVEIALYDLLGKQISVLKNERESEGDYKLELNAQSIGLADGMYLVVFRTEETTAFIKLLFKP